MNTVLLASIYLVLSVTTAAADRTAEPFNGKDLSGWKVKGKPSGSYWKVGGAKLHPDDPSKFVVGSGTELVNDKGNADRGRGINIYSEFQHGTGRIEIEVMVPKGSNSGVYVQGEYEVQVFDQLTRYVVLRIVYDGDGSGGGSVPDKHAKYHDKD